MFKGFKIFFKNLKLYSAGKKVQKASILLANHGSKLKPTSEFSLAMRSAVMAFQRKNGLEVTGVIDWTTWCKLTSKPA